MKRRHLFTIASCWTMLAIGIADAGTLVMPPPGPARIANADAVIGGKVESIEPQDVKIGNVTYRIAVVQIKDGIKGTKDGVKSLRVGFVPIAKPKPGVFVSGGRPVQLEVGKEGLFLLKKIDKSDIYQVGGIVGYYVNSENNKDFDKEVATAKAAAKIADNPQAALKSKDADERLAAAAILVDKHRTFRGPNSKQEPIDADESKLILQTLAKADWQAQSNFASLRANPAQVFQRLGVTKTDGFVPPPGGNYQEAIRTWLTRNADSYRIQRFVASDKK